MPSDMDDLMRSGSVSARSAKKYGVGVRGPRAAPSTHMEKRQKDEGHVHNDGMIATKTHINERSLQHTGKGGMPSKGGGIGGKRAEYYPGPKQIDQFPQKQHREYPPESEVRGKPRAGVPNTKAKTKIAPMGGYYGGGGQNTQ